MTFSSSQMFYWIELPNNSGYNMLTTSTLVSDFSSSLIPSTGIIHSLGRILFFSFTVIIFQILYCINYEFNISNSIFILCLTVEFIFVQGLVLINSEYKRVCESNYLWSNSRGGLENLQ